MDFLLSLTASGVEGPERAWISQALKQFPGCQQKNCNAGTKGEGILAIG